MKKRILLVLPIKQSTVLVGLIRALRFINCDVGVFDYRETTIEEKFFNLTRQKNIAQKSMNIRLELVVKSFHPSMLFIVKGELIYPETLSKIKRGGVLCVNWFPDDMQLYDLAKQLCPNYDLFMHFDSYAITKLQKDLKAKNLYQFRFAADILPQDPIPQYIDRPYNLTLIGNPYPHRVKNLPMLLDLGLNIWGVEKWQETTLQPAYHGFLPFDKVDMTLKQSKIGLNMQYDSPCQGLVNRAYDVAKAGAMLLNDDRKEIPEIYEPEKEVVVYRNISECYQLASYYGNHEMERQKIARHGYLAVSHRHTYIQRFQQLFKHLDIK